MCHLHGRTLQTLQYNVHQVDIRLVLKRLVITRFHGQPQVEAATQERKVVHICFVLQSFIECSMLMDLD